MRLCPCVQVSYLSPTMTPRDLPKIILRLIYYVIYLLNSNYELMTHVFVMAFVRVAHSA